MSNPLVSIVLSVFNGADSLDLCLKSISKQSYDKFEIIFIDDCSTDNTVELAQKWQTGFAPDQMKIHINRVNMGLTKSLNIGINKSSGNLVARIDVDDLWKPKKLEKQVTFMNSHPDFGVVGCWYINNYGNSRRKVRLPVTDESIKRNIYKRNPFGHSCVVMRRELLKREGGYDEKLVFGQDRELWFRLLLITKMANLSEVLCYRSVDSDKSKTNKREQIWQTVRTVNRYILKYRAPWFYYIYLLEPLLMLLVPQQFKNFIRR